MVDTVDWLERLVGLTEENTGFGSQVEQANAKLDIERIQSSQSWDVAEYAEEVLGQKVVGVGEEDGESAVTKVKVQRRLVLRQLHHFRNLTVEDAVADCYVGTDRRHIHNLTRKRSITPLSIFLAPVLYTLIASAMTAGRRSWTTARPEVYGSK